MSDGALESAHCICIVVCASVSPDGAVKVSNYNVLPYLCLGDKGHTSNLVPGVVCRHQQRQCSLYRSDIMDALLADKHSMLAGITIVEYSTVSSSSRDRDVHASSMIPKNFTGQLLM